MEYMSEGDLRSYLQNCRKYLQQKTGSKEEKYALTQVKLLQWALDIVNGMFHLHSKDVSSLVLITKGNTFNYVAITFLIYTC